MFRVKPFIGVRRSVGVACAVEIRELVDFVRGDANGDGDITVADAVFVLGYLFGGGPRPRCLDAADANDNEGINIADAIALLGHLFGNEGPLPEPFVVCGPDPSPSGLSCLEYACPSAEDPCGGRRPIAAMAFQNEGTCCADVLNAVACLDGIWSPADLAPFGTVVNDSFACGPSGASFDALSLVLDPTGLDPGRLVLKIYMAKGSQDVAWQHYEILPGLFNPQDEDAVIPPDSIDVNPSGALPLGALVGWVAVSLPDIREHEEYRDANGRIVATLRLWNWRLDKIELVEYGARAGR